jgi:hypothetical protein
MVTIIQRTPTILKDESVNIRKENALGMPSHHQLKLMWWRASATQEEALLTARQIKGPKQQKESGPDARRLA